MDLGRDTITFVLSNTCFSDNLGGAARILQNMGFSRLLLVHPRCEVGAEARARAMRGATLLDEAAICPSLQEAAEEFDLLIGTSCRFPSQHPNRALSRQFASEILPLYARSRIGIVFGSEENGLSRSEIELCHWIIEIATASDYQSINLAQAVALVAYDFSVALSRQTTEDSPILQQATATQTEGLIDDLRRTIAQLELPAPVSAERVIKRLQRLAGRAALEEDDIHLLRGLLRRIRAR